MTGDAVAALDWTADENGRSNSSAEFQRLVAEVARLIRDEAHSLLSGNTEGAARLIMAQLAHVHGLGPHPDAAEVERLLREVAGIGLYAYEDPSNFWNDPKREEMLGKLRVLSSTEAVK